MRLREWCCLRDHRYRAWPIDSHSETDIVQLFVINFPFPVLTCGLFHAPILHQTTKFQHNQAMHIREIAIRRCGSVSRAWPFPAFFLGVERPNRIYQIWRGHRSVILTVQFCLKFQIYCPFRNQDDSSETGVKNWDKIWDFSLLSLKN